MITRNPVIIIIIIAPAILILLSVGVTAREDLRPRAVAKFDEMPKPALLPDGSLVAFFIPTVNGEQEVAARFSKDNGSSWSELQTLFKLPKGVGGFGYFEDLVDRDGEVHLFFLNDAGTGVIRPRAGEEAHRIRKDQQRLDIWHTRSLDGRTRWQQPKPIWEGRAADLQSVIQLRSGRILLPISYLTTRSWGARGSGFDAFTYMGQFDTTVLYSDDAGGSWRQSPVTLKVPTPDLSTLGGVEPVILQLKDGRVWMLIRTQMGRFYESFSIDGVSWPAPQPSRIISSDSPAGLVRLVDGRILLLWNNSLRFPYAYGGRHVLHAAISEDEGHTWRGYREVIRDPLRNQPPPPTGDHGTSYPFPALTKDGKVIFSTWVSTGPGRSLVLLDPAWLYETTQKTDFSAGMEEWSSFGTRGVGLIPHPQKRGARVLSIRKTEAGWPAAAVWNFPAGARGRLRLNLLLRPGFAGSLVGLTDHFSVPFDQQDKFYNLYNLNIGPGGRLAKGEQLQPDRWYSLQLDWDGAKRECRVSVDGRQVAVLPQLREGEGASYLRLRSTAEESDGAGMFVESVEADVSPSW